MNEQQQAWYDGWAVVVRTFPGHRGRPGQRGGSMARGASHAYPTPPPGGVVAETITETRDNLLGQIDYKGLQKKTNGFAIPEGSKAIFDDVVAKVSAMGFGRDAARSEKTRRQRASKGKDKWVGLTDDGTMSSSVTFGQFMSWQEPDEVAAEFKKEHPP